MKKVTAKVALVTGSNRGIGFAVVKGLSEKGIHVILTSRTAKDGKAAVKQLNRDNVYYHPLDVTAPESVRGLVAYVPQEFGRLDILINNAGINYDTWQNVANANLENVQETLGTNLMGPWRVSQAFLPLMEKNNFGRIVNVSSGAGELASLSGGTPGYSISKAALNALTLSFSRHLQGKNILVNAVCPGWVRTQMGGAAAPKSPEEGAATIIWAALFQDNGPTGKFFRDKREVAW